MTTIMVTGVGGPAGRNVAALLRARGHAVVGTDVREVSVPGARVVTVPLAGDPLFLEGLARVAARERVDLLIPTVTEELPIIAERWSLFSPIPAVIGPADAVRTAHDKYFTSRRLAERGVSVPRHCLPSEVGSPREVAERLGWPCLSKPRVGRGGRGVAVWNEADWTSVAALDDRSILQEFLSGTDYCPNLFVGRAPGSHAVVIVMEKTALKEGIVGNALSVQRVTAPDVTALASEAAAALGFSGPLDVDVRRGADGRPAVLEINARFGANIASAPEILDAALADWSVR